MRFTQEDYRNIENWIYNRTLRDTDFPLADPITGAEEVTIVQDNTNKRMSMYDLINQISNMNIPDFFNVTLFTKQSNMCIKEAISSVPVNKRKLGLVITFRNGKGNWVIYQFKGTSLSQWCSLNCWDNIVYNALEDLIFYPDEEDITGIQDANRTYLKFKNKAYDPKEFSGLGRVYLRKNYKGTQACSIDDEDHYTNILSQDMISEANTIYIVQYDFDLDGKVIAIPENSVLWFQGGSINNGSIYLSGTTILGAFEFADIGDVKLFGTFNTGQIMAFSDASYKEKTGGYFIASTKKSSASVEADPKNDSETFYDVNNEAYTTTKRQELRWWNGEQWVRVLDITDYNEVISIIKDLIDKHNTEMSECYKYFKARCAALENRVTNAENTIKSHESTIKDHETRITGNTSSIEDIKNSIKSIENSITNIDSTVISAVQNYLSTNIVGAKSVTVNGSTYNIDSAGNINLPDYPKISKEDIKELTVKRGDTTLGTYDGSEEKTISIPDNKKLIFTGAVNAEYNGDAEVTINIPESSNGGGSSLTQPQILFAGYIKRTGIESSSWSASGSYISPSVSANIVTQGATALKVTFSSAPGTSLNIISAVANLRENYARNESKFAVSDSSDNLSQQIVATSIQSIVMDNYILLNGWAKTDNNQRSVSAMGLRNASEGIGSPVLSVNLIVIGTITNEQ